eukprot:m.27576 g.27576  ORF g.27576 m.27576 type:complete len:273 (+) comp7909_c0_seq1:241-1059(+)
MAKSKYEYVKSFESDDRLLPNTFLVARLDGRGFHRFTECHGFTKPNDIRGITLMNEAAKACMNQFQDIVIGYGESDEFSFVFKRETTLFKRRASKIITSLVSCFTGHYVMLWSTIMIDPTTGNQIPLQYVPQFDGRIICYPTAKNLRDYLSWRQADTHINNLYNTCFWTLIQQGEETPANAEEILRGTVSSDKNELLFSRFGINYSKENPMFRKGSVLTWQLVDIPIVVKVPASTEPKHNNAKVRQRKQVSVTHEDIIGDKFWKDKNFIVPQ